MSIRTMEWKDSRLGDTRKVTSAEWQVTLCDLIWHVISRSGAVISITNCYIRFTNDDGCNSSADHHWWSTYSSQVKEASRQCRRETPSPAECLPRCCVMSAAFRHIYIIIITDFATSIYGTVYFARRRKDDVTKHEKKSRKHFNNTSCFTWALVTRIRHVPRHSSLTQHHVAYVC